VSMSDKELKRLSVLQEICDQCITQSQAAQLLHISERQIRRLLQKYKAQGPAALAQKLIEIGVPVSEVLPY